MITSNVRPMCDPASKDLTVANITTAQPGDVLRDAKIRGLQLRCTEERKSFLLYYRTKAGVERRPKIGDFGTITLAQAKKIAQEMLGEVAAGRDPSQARSEARSEPTMSDLWDEYWKRHGSKKKSSDEDQRIWEQYLQPLAPKKLSHLTYSGIADLHQKITDRPAPVQANRVLSLLSKMFSFGMHPLEWMEKNPATGVKKNREVARKRYTSLAECEAIATALDAEAVANPAAVAFLYLLILTGARKGEIAAAKWSQVNGGCITLGEHKADQRGDARFIRLPQAAMDVLETLPRTHGTITGLLDPKKTWAKVREAAGCPDLHMHDLRHSFASAALSAGIPLAQIGELLGHKTSQTTKRYAHLEVDAATASASKTTDLIMSRMRPSLAVPAPEVTIQ